MKKLFTERHGGGKPRIAESLDETTREALLTLVRARMDEEWFGLSFPAKCPDGFPHAGTDFVKLRATMNGYGLLWPTAMLDSGDPPLDGVVFDLVEFAYEHVAAAQDPEFHRFMSHSHYAYDQEVGQQKFASDVNRIFERNGMAFELVDGEIIRRAPTPLHENLASTFFKTGDAILDDLLEIARAKFLNRSLDVRREALEKLWDAWERLKTQEPGKDKKAKTKVLLDRAATEPTFRDRLEQEAVHLTAIGNEFMIRHAETDKVPVEVSAHVDYLFHRMFAMVRLLLTTTGRGG